MSGKPEQKGSLLSALRNYQSTHQSNIDAAGRVRQMLHVLYESEQMVNALTQHPKFTETPNSELRAAITMMAKAQEEMLNTLINKIKGTAQPGGYLEELKDINLDDPRLRSQISRHVSRLASKTWDTWRDDEVSFDRIQKLMFLSMMTYYRLTPKLVEAYQTEYEVAKHQKLDTALSIVQSSARVEEAVSLAITPVIDSIPAMHKVIWGKQTSEEGVRNLVENVMLPESDDRLQAMLDDVEDETGARPASRDIHVARRAMLRIVAGEMVNIIQHEKSAFLSQVQELRKTNPDEFKQHLAKGGLLSSWVVYRLKVRRDAYPTASAVFAHMKSGNRDLQVADVISADARGKADQPPGGFSPPRGQGGSVDHPQTLTNDQVDPAPAAHRQAEGKPESGRPDSGRLDSGR